jgi:hypothetical protein
LYSGDWSFDAHLLIAVDASFDSQYLMAANSSFNVGLAW